IGQNAQSPPYAKVFSLAFSPNGKFLATTSFGGPERERLLLWDATPLDEKPPTDCLTLRAHDASARGLAYSPDAKQLGGSAADGSLKLFDAIKGEELRRFAGHSKCCAAAVYFHDGRRIASIGLDRTVRIWDADTGDELRTITLAGNSFCFAISPD